MGRKLPFLPTCGSLSKTLSFHAVTTVISGDLEDVVKNKENDSSIESVIRGLSSDRFFFNPGKTSSILEEAKSKEKEKDVTPFKENVSMMEMESTDPFLDFKKSMQEMVEAEEGLRQWDNLQELLSMYLSLNDKINHGYIIRAFVDLLLVNLGSSSTSTSSCSSSINSQEPSLLITESGTSTSSNNNKMMISSESPESALSFTSSSASTSETCSSTSHCLSSCSLEDDDDDDENHEDDEDHNSPQKVEVQDDATFFKV